MPLIAALTPLCGGVGGGAEDMAGVEVVAYLANASPIQRHLKNQLHHRGRLFVDDKVVVVGGVFQVAVGGRGGHIQAAVEPGTEGRFHLHRHVGGVHFVQDIAKRGDVHGALVQRVHPVVDGDIAHPMLREEHFQIQPAVQIVAAQPGQVFGDDAVDTLGLNVPDHALETGSLEIRPRIAVVHIGLDKVPAPLTHIVDEDGLLRPNAGALVPVAVLFQVLF